MKKHLVFGLALIVLAGLLIAQVPGRYLGFTADRFWKNDGTICTDNTIQGTGFILKGTGNFNTTLQAGAATASKTYTLPLTDGATGQALVTNGSAVLSWSTATTSSLSSELNVNAALAADGVLTTTIAAGSVGIVMVKETTALNQYFLLTPTTVGGALMTNTAYSATKDNALTLNVYVEGAVVKLQNKTAAAINVKVGFAGFN